MLCCRERTHINIQYIIKNFLRINRKLKLIDYIKKKMIFLTYFKFIEIDKKEIN